MVSVDRNVRSYVCADLLFFFFNFNQRIKYMCTSNVDKSERVKRVKNKIIYGDMVRGYSSYGTRLVSAIVRSTDAAS